MYLFISSMKKKLQYNKNIILGDTYLMKCYVDDKCLYLYYRIRNKFDFKTTFAIRNKILLYVEN